MSGSGTTPAEAIHPIADEASRRSRSSSSSLSGPHLALASLPVLIGVVLIVLPADADLRVTDVATANAALASAAAHHVGSWLGLLLVTAVFPVAMVALLPLVRSVTGRGQALMRIGYALSVLGAAGLAVENAIVAVTLRSTIDHHVSHDAAVSFLISLQKDHGPLLPLLLLALGMFIGPLLMLAGSIRSTEVTWWRGLLAAALVVGLVVSAPGASGLVYLAVTLASAVALWPITPARYTTDAPMSPGE